MGIAHVEDEQMNGSRQRNEQPAARNDSGLDLLRATNIRVFDAIRVKVVEAE